MHLQLEVAIFQASHGNCIIEITRRLAINRDDRQRPEVSPLLQFTRRNERFRFLCFLENLRRKAVWQMVLADHDFNIQAKIIFVAQYLDYTSARILRSRRPVGDLDINHNVFQIVWPGALYFFTQHAMHALLSLFFLGVIAGLFRKLKSRGDDDLLRDFLINRRHIVVAVGIVEEADYGGMGAMERAHDATLGATIGTNSGDFDQHAIAVHRRTDGRRRDENISGQASLQAFIEQARVGYDKAEAVAMHAQAAHDQVLVGCGLGNCIAIGIYLDQLFAAHQPF